MNNVLDIRRFWNYFLYDLRRAKNNYGLSLLLIGLTPVIFFLIFAAWSLLWHGSVGTMDASGKFVAVFVSLTVVLLASGAKIYGFVTEKRAGADFLMLPASSMEKWLSCVLTVCIVLPAVLFSLLFAGDALLALILPGSYGARFFAGAGEDFFRMLSVEGIRFNLPFALFLNWCENMLIFTLGAVCFKKSKVAKTFLCLMAVGMVFSFLMVWFFGNAFPDLADWAESHFDDPAVMARTLNRTISIFYAVVIGGLLGGLYYRIRTIQQ